MRGTLNKYCNATCCTFTWGSPCFESQGCLVTRAGDKHTAILLNTCQRNMHLSFILLFLHLWGNVEVSLSQNACSKLPDVPHAYASPEYKEGDVIQFTCESGYRSDQTSKYICTSNGWLTVRQGICYSCSTLPSVLHAHISEETRKSEYQVGDVIHFTCESGYTSDPSITYVCSTAGWVAVRQGTCNFSGLSCDPPPVSAGIIINGLPENNNPIHPDHVLTFSCDGPEKYLHGSSVLTCGRDGQWDNPFPSCTEKCRVTGIPDNVNVSPSVRQLTTGQKLTFSCRQRGNFIRGAAEVKCLANGQWSDPFPTCGAPLGCGRPPTLADGDTKETIQLRYGHNDRVEFICQNFYVMQGGPFKTCLNGEWTGEITCLKPCTVDRELMSRYNIAFRYTYQDKLYVVHDDVTEFACTRGRHTGSLGMRQRCIDGVLHLPSCQ
ncbi:complement factor H like 5 [Toxotes jaculatrix]|uniref:complement factor H like 5 n=1 Tax=Toxotes jaculatrix TaxID=941984 RepID=UPI001B3AE42E|nr:complement factor H like 5 [Toxotes jaculatrix]